MWPTSDKLCKFLLAYLCLNVDISRSQVFNAGSPAPPHRPTSNGAIWSSSSESECKPGDLIPGPTCNSFYMCTGPLYAAKKVKFQCAPGTVFDDGLNACVHGIGSKCLESIPVSTVPPYPPSPVIPGAVTTVPLPSPPGTTVEAENSCTTYELDPTTVYECPEPGYYPSLSDCSRFYKCIVTMNCIMKGYMFRCPSNYLYVASERRCLKEEEAGTCERVADASGQTHIVTSVVDLTPENLDDFFQADGYWGNMPFLPTEFQKIVAVNPSTYSRESNRGFFMQGP